MKVVRNLFDLNIEDRGKVVIIPDLSAPMVLKAEVIGVKSIITRNGLTKEENDRIKINLPIVEMEEAEFEKLLIDNN